MSETTTRGIRIHVRTEYLAERSSPGDDSWVFAYHVTITNVGDEPAQLISRTWIITDSDGNEQRVQGPGVVGEQPRLEAGQSFRYTSYCPLRTAVGSMHGSYAMQTDRGETFEAVIAPFTLAVPHVVN